MVYRLNKREYKQRTCGTHLGLTKLPASMFITPARASLLIKSTLTFTGIMAPFSFCRPSRGPTSTMFTVVLVGVEYDRRLRTFPTSRLWRTLEEDARERHIREIEDQCRELMQAGRTKRTARGSTLGSQAIRNDRSGNSLAQEGNNYTSPKHQCTLDFAVMTMEGMMRVEATNICVLSNKIANFQRISLTLLDLG